MARAIQVEEPATTYPRLATLWASAAYLVASLTLGFPALAGKFLVNVRSDQYIAGYAFREYAASTLRASGHFPLWNPYLFGGMPYVAAMHGDIFYPTFLLRLVMPTDVAMTWGFIIHLFLAGLFTYLFLRALGLGFFAALIGGLAYMMGGNVAGLASPGHDGKLFMSALLPMTLLLLTRAIRDGRLWAYGALAFVVGLAILTPHPQLLQYLLLASGAFALFLAFADTGAGSLPRRDAVRRLAASAAAVAVGLAIGAIQFLPVREYVPWSPRAPGHSWEIATSYSMPPEEIVNFYIPQFSGMLDLYWGRNPIHLHSEYIGAAVLLFAVLAFSSSSPPSKRRMIWFWTGTFVVALFWAFGGFTPFYRVVYAIVPGTRYFRAPSTMLFLASFCIAVLAAFGVDRALRGEVTKRYLLVSAGIAAVIGMLGISGGLTNLAMAVAEAGRAEGAVANEAALRFGTLRSTLFAAFTLTALFLFATRRLSRSATGALLAGIVTVDLWTIERIYWIFSEPAAKLYASDAIVDHLKKETTPFRVLPLLLQSDAVAFRDPFMSGDALMVHRIRNARGYHGNELGRYQRLEEGDQGRSSIANPNFWALENIRFILSANGGLDSLGLTNAKRIMGPVTNAAGSSLYLYQVTNENPFAWVAPVIVKAGDDAALGTVLDPRFDVRRAAIFDTLARVSARTVQSLPEAVGIHATATRYEPEAIDITLDQAAPSGSALVVSENFYPGWSATADGKPVVIGRADMTLIGVELPAGARSVSLRFASRPFETGKIVTLGALLLAVLALGGGAYLGRRTRG